MNQSAGYCVFRNKDTYESFNA